MTTVARTLVYLITGPTVSEPDSKAQLFNGETANQCRATKQHQLGYLDVNDSIESSRSPGTSLEKAQLRHNTRSQDWEVSWTGSLVYLYMLATPTEP